MIIVDIALHKAVLKLNTGCHRATKEIFNLLGLEPDYVAFWRAAKKDAVRMYKPNNHQQL